MKRMPQGIRSLTITPTMHITLVVLFLMFTACATVNSGEELPTAISVDISRYAGKWYEIARLPMWAQRKCLRSTAEYTLLESGEIGVRNACITRDGEETSIEGVATIVDHIHRTKLNVVFDQWAAKLVAFFTSSDEGNYWILRVDQNTTMQWWAHQIVSIYGSWPVHQIFQKTPTKTLWRSVNASGSRLRT